MKKLLLTTTAIILAAITTASAADLKAPVYTKAPPPPPPLFNWSGFYIGANVGGKWAFVDDTVISGPTTVTFNNDNPSSWIAGGQVGYNWQAPGSPWVFGVEGDIDAQDFNRTRVIGVAIGPFIPGDAFTIESKWQASLRGRIGYAVDRSLFYVTGGAAFTQIKGTVGLVGIGSFTDDRTRTGATVGGGFEYAFTNNLSLGIEGRYTWYGDENFNTTLGGIPVNHTISLNTAEVMGKLNFKFW